MAQIRTDMNMYTFTQTNEQKMNKKQKKQFKLIHIQFTNTLSSVLSDFVWHWFNLNLGRLKLPKLIQTGSEVIIINNLKYLTATISIQTQWECSFAESKMI